MHELSIADSIVRIAERHANGRRVSAVEVRVGALRQVVPSALSFAFELVAQGTPVEGAVLELAEVPAVVACRACGGESEVEGFPLACRACKSLDVDVLAGEDLLVESLEVGEEVVGATHSS
jgi:hydrogenase nickel incorporation protein HypA/HybF